MNFPDLRMSFFTDDVDYSWRHQEEIFLWLSQVVKDEQKTLGHLNFIMTSDEGLLKINKEFLKHDYYTDVITFPLREDLVDGEIYLSYDRILDNADKLKLTFELELYRVVLHGVLHLIGYKDKNDQEKALIREKEDFYLNLRDF